MPGAGDLDASMMLLFQEVKKKCTVVLSGECADEVFAGYPWFHSNHFLDKEELPNPPALIAGKMVLLRPEWKEKVNFLEHSKHLYNQIIADVPLLPGDDPENIKVQKMHFLNFYGIMHFLLERKDRLSMWYGVEVRVPYADHELMEYVWNIPRTIKTVNGVEKSVLRNALVGILPEPVRTRTKSMYPATSDPALLKGLQDLIRKEILDNPTAPILQFYDKQKIEEHMNGVDTSFGKTELATLVQTNYWLEAYHVQYVE